MTQSDVEAVKWYQKAAAQGHAGAQTYLAFMHADGQGGLTRSAVLAGV